MKWTPAQQQTIEERGKNILVSAAAGSGKTTVLIERIKQLVLRDRVDIDRFLITTFTNAAAAEMKEKMQRAIHQELDRAEQREADRAYLQRQLDLLPQSSISTFHTFSLGIMRDFFYLTDLQPGFVIGDETQLSILRREAVDQVFEERFDDDRDSFCAFLRKYSSDRNDDRLKEQVLKIYQELRSIPRYMDWASRRIECMRQEDPVHALGIDQFLLTETADALGSALRWYAEAERILDTEETGSLHLKARQDREVLEMLQRLAAAEAEGTAAAMRSALQQLREGLEGYKPNTMRATKAEKDAYEAVKEQVTWLRKQGKKCVDQLRRRYYAQTLEEAGQILQQGADDTAYFVGLIQDAERIYREKKQARNMVDFDDCMHYALEILQDENAAADYRDRFQYIFIDEYQDSNLLQEEIVGRIARQDNLFMVGDVKQSIYKFRLAEPEIFRDRYEAYRNGSDEHSIRIDLNSNFRSRRTIRDAVNRIFENIMDGYDEDARLNGPEQEETLGDPVSLHIISRTVPESMLDGNAAAEQGAAGEGNTAENGPAANVAGLNAAVDANEDVGAAADEDREDPSETLSEMEVIEQIIRESIGQPITDRDGNTRGIDYGDIAVLSRGGSFIPQIERYLNNEGIPAFGETAGGYYETVEIQVFLNLLKVISNRNQDVPLISAMSSVVFDFSPAQLAQIRIECREGSFSSAVRHYEAEGSDPRIREKIRGMMEQITLWKEIGRTVPLDELMRRLLYETGYYDYCSGLPTGEQRISNLRLLLEKAAAYEESSHLGLYGFLSYVDAMQRTRQKVSEASLASEGRSVVHIMTVHKSKGLEFPVVILAGAGKKISGSSEGRAPAMHKAFAIGLPEVDREHHWERKTLLQKAIAGRKSREGLEEEIRILYVALTRPMTKLAIVGAVKDVDKLQRFPGKGSFLEMIYGTLTDMAEKDPSAAKVILHLPGEKAFPKAGPAASETHASELPVSGMAASESPAPEAVITVQKSASELADSVALQSMDSAELDRRLSWVYPFAQQQLVKTKYSVTELSRMESGRLEQLPVQIPELQQPKTESQETAARLTAAVIGTAMHTVMERIDFPAALEEGLPYIQNAAKQLQEDGFLTEAEYHAVRPEDILGFFQQPPGARAAQADVLCREKEFLLQQEIHGVPAILQGIIDCYYEDEDGLVLIDYKNSWVGSEDAEEAVIQRYAGQVRLYAQALQEALGRPVDEAWLYLFRSRKFVSMPLEESDGYSGSILSAE